MRYRVLPYRQGSRSASSLAGALGGKVLKLSGSSYKPRGGDVLINWGNTTQTGLTALLNPPERILGASNKMRFFQRMAEAGHTDIIPPFWTNQDDIPDDAFPIVCRTVLAGHSGDGIVMADSRQALVLAPLYTGYVKKKDEYRVHCGKRGNTPEIIAVQRKARRLGEENVNWQVRNHSNGFIYSRVNVDPPAPVKEAALATFASTGLDFGGVDVVYNEHSGRAYVLEINTAPGLEGQTINDYRDFFKSL